MTVEASLIFSSSERPEGLLSFSISARCASSAAVMCRSCSSAFSASLMEACFWISWAVGIRSSIFPDMVAPSSSFLTIAFDQATAALGLVALIQIKRRRPWSRTIGIPGKFDGGRRSLTDQLHPMTPHHLPFYLARPGETDVLMIVMGIFLVLAVLGVGNLYLRLHSLPEQMAHKSQKLQFELVAVLGLISLFTHMHIFWIAGLLLALVDLPDFGTPLNRIAGSVERIADSETPPAEPAADEAIADQPAQAVIRTAPAAAVKQPNVPAKEVGR